MQTNISEKYQHTEFGQEADKILRSCVHCGFCTATCPTYQLLGDELDGPRGRIYLIKQMLEGQRASQKTQLHLDRCLTCRSCETTCPSGVQYARLVDIGRHLIEKEIRRPLWPSLQRFLLQKIIAYPRRFSLFLGMGRLIKPMLPNSLKYKIPDKQSPIPTPATKHERRMLVLQGCAQSVTTPRTNMATRRVLDALGIELISASEAGCCGALSHHLAACEEALDFMRNNIDAWWPHIENGAEAIISTASGCGLMLKDYGEQLKNDEDYAEKAQRVSELTRDVSEVLQNETLSELDLNPEYSRVAFHSPCTLQHGMKLNGVVENILVTSGFILTQVTDSHLCCGSAGTYSILQPELSKKLANNKVSALEENEPEMIITANVGCQLQLASHSNLPVKHWIELINDSFTSKT